MKVFLFWPRILGGALLVPLAFAGCGGGSSNSGNSGPTVSSNIVFVSTRDGNAEIYRMNADGTGQTRLTNTSATEDGPRLSRDGSRVVFSSQHAGNPEIYLMNSDGSMNPDGTGAQRLTADTGANAPDDSFPTISPDNSQIAWNSTRGGTLGIWLMDATGANQRRLADGRNPSFSPDGTQLVYADSRNSRPVLVIRTLATGAERVIDPNVSPTLLNPRWSSDGNRIIFTSPARASSSLRVVSAAATGNTTATAGPSAGNVNSFGSFNPRGGTVIFDGQNLTSPNPSRQIFVADATTFASPRPLTTLGENSQPSFGN